MSDRRAFERRRRLIRGGGFGAGLVPAVLTWITGGDDNTPTLRLEVPIGAMVEGDSWEIRFYSDAGLTTQVAIASGEVNSEDAGDGEIDGNLSNPLIDGTFYARGRVIGKTGWSNVESQTIEAAPSMTSASSANIDENEQLAFALTASQPSTFAITGGADSAQFEISGSTLRWVSNGVKDFDSPDDADTDNAYVVEVTPTAIHDSEAGSAQTITITVQNVSEAGWVPNDMFDPGAKWVWYDIQDTSTLFADTAGTTPASVDGAVRRINDKSGNGAHLTTFALSQSPILRLSSGVYYLEFDGTNDCFDNNPAYLAALFQNVGLGVIGVACRTGGGNDKNPVFFSINSSASSTRARINYMTSVGYVAGGRRLDADTFASISEGEANTADAAVVGLFEWANSNLSLYVNGVLENSTASFQTDGNTTDAASLQTTVGATNAGVAQWDGRIYQVIAGVPNTTDMSELSTFLLDKMGL